MPPRVSVIVATRDRPQLLREALEGIAGQDYDGVIETVVVFDRSEPDTDLVVTSPTRPVTVLRNERTPGLQGARNTGIVATHGDLVAFCDDDDVWMPSKIRKQVALLTTNPDVHIVGCGVTVQYEGEAVDRVRADVRVTFRDLLRSRVFEAHPSTFLMRRVELIDRIGLVDEEVPGGYGEDYEWLLRTTGVTDLLLVPEPLVRVRWHTASFYSERWQMRLEGLQYILDRYPQFDSEPAGLARIKGQMAFARAALGHRRRALRLAAEALRLNPTEMRAPLALAVAAGVPPASIVMWLQRRGKSI